MRWTTAVCIAVFCLWTVPGHAVQILSSHAGTTASPESMSLLNPLDAGSGIFIVRDGSSNISIGGTRDAFGNFSLSSNDRLIIAPEPGIEAGRITLRSSTVSLSGGTISGQAGLSTSGILSISSGIVLTTAVAPVPLPAALPLYATGLGVLSLFLKRRRLV